MKMMSVAVFSVIAPLALGGCTNGCSGHGKCGQYDMCSCYRGWRGHDCSERVCPSDYSFVTSPQGDLNFDGDAYDSFLKPIVGSKAKGTAAQTLEPIHGGNQVIMKGSMAKNDNKFTFDVAGAVTATELVSGDSVLIDDEVFVVTSVNFRAADSGQGTELYMSTRASVAHATRTSQIFKMLEAQGQVGGAWESWPGYANAKYDEAHFYMECSNKGHCDRKTGTCACFDGYEGKACSRMSCPGEDSPCSGHGLCQDVATLAWSSPALASFKAKAATAGATTITVSESFSGTDFATALPYIRFGRYMNESVKVTATSGDGLSFTIANAIDQPLEDFTEIYVVYEYKLWDRKKARTCTCDAGWSGYDCNTRVCPKGDDPLTVAGSLPTHSATTSSSYTQENEKQTISIVGPTSSAGTGLGTGYAVAGALGLTFTDQYGYQWDAQADQLTKLSVKATAGGTAAYTFATPLPASEISVGDFLTTDGNVFHTVSSVTASNTAGFITGVVTANTVVAITGNVNLYVAGYVKSIASALLGLPNDVVPSVLVTTRVSKEHDLQGLQTVVAANSYRIRVDFTSQFNSGDIPEMGCNTSDLVTAVYAQAVGSVDAGSVTVSTVSSVDGASFDYTSGSAVGDAILIGREKRIIVSRTDGSITVDSAFGQTYSGEPIGVVQGTYSSTISCSVTDEPALVWGAAGSYSSIAKVDIADGKTVSGIDSSSSITSAGFLDSNDVRVNTIVKAANVGGHADSSAPATTAPTEAPTFQPTATTVRRRLAAGDDPTTFSAMTSFGAHYTGAFEYRVVDEKLTNTFTVSEQFDQGDLNEWQYMWISEKGRTEAIECSRRGNCDGESGQCTCYAGYTGAACQTQSALSF